MSNIRLSGVLLDPVDSSPDIGAEMRFTHKTTTGETIKGAQSVVKFEAPLAAYDFTLSYGQIIIEYKTSPSASFSIAAVIVVNDDNKSTTIPELLNSGVPLTPKEIAYIEQILADATVQAENSEASAAAALVSENNSGAYAAAALSSENSAQDEANRSKDEADRSTVEAEKSSGSSATAQVYSIEASESAPSIIELESNMIRMQTMMVDFHPMY